MMQELSDDLEAMHSSMATVLKMLPNALAARNVWTTPMPLWNFAGCPFLLALAGLWAAYRHGAAAIAWKLWKMLLESACPASLYAFVYESGIAQLWPTKFDVCYVAAINWAICNGFAQCPAWHLA